MTFSVLSHKQQRRLIRAIKESPVYDPDMPLPHLTWDLYKLMMQSREALDKRHKKKRKKKKAAKKK